VPPLLLKGRCCFLCITVRENQFRRSKKVDMKGIPINDLPERYQRQVRTQLAACPVRSPDAKPECNEQAALVQKSGGTPCMVHSNRPLLVRITRNRGRTLDTDNLAGVANSYAMQSLPPSAAKVIQRKKDLHGNTCKKAAIYY